MTKNTVEMMETTIQKGRTMRIQDGKGLDLTVVTGTLWVTHEHDARDLVLGPHDVFTVRRDGLTLIHAFRDVQLRIAYPAGAEAPSLTFGGGYREFGSSVMRAMIAGWARGIRGWFVAGTARRGLSAQ
jgi:hypothetical protein